MNDDTLEREIRIRRASWMRNTYPLVLLVVDIYLMTDDAEHFCKYLSSPDSCQCSGWFVPKIFRQCLPIQFYFLGLSPLAMVQRQRGASNAITLRCLLQTRNLLGFVDLSVFNINAPSAIALTRPTTPTSALSRVYWKLVGLVLA